MSYSLYNFLPTEIVWKIYDDLHNSYTKDLNKELLQYSNYVKRNYDNFPLASNIKLNENDYDDEMYDDLDIKYRICGSYSSNYVITENDRNKCYKELHDEFDSDFFNQHSQFWVKGEYYQYRDYDDFRFNNVDNFVNNEEDEDDVEYVYFGNNQYEDQPNDWDFDEEFDFRIGDYTDETDTDIDFI